MAVTNYYTVNDEIIGEHAVGQSRLDYLTDGLGGVVGTLDQTLTAQCTARYKPYGADLATTGTQSAFGYVGGFGYRRTGRPHADFYIRARTLSSQDAGWTTVDPLWPWESAYIYADGAPTVWVDPSGRVVEESSPATSEGGAVGSGTSGSGSGGSGNGGSGAPTCPPRDANVGGFFAPYVMFPFILGEEIGKAYFGPKRRRKPQPTPRRNPRNAEEVRQAQRCKALYRKQGQICSQGRSCDGVSSKDCAELRSRSQLSSECALIRSEIILECDYQDDPVQWTPNICGHQMAMCQAEKSACDCISKGYRCNPPVGSLSACAGIQASCANMARACFRSASDFWR